MNWAIARGFSVWQIGEEWLEAENMEDLLHKILERFEYGFFNTDEQIKEDADLAVKAGGHPALKALYPWHPLFVDIVTLDSDDAYVAMQQHTEMITDGTKTGVPGTAKGGGHHNDHHTDGSSNDNLRKGALSNSVLQSLGDQQWLATSEAAEAKLEASRLHSGRHVTDSIAQATKSMIQHGHANKSFMDILVSNMMSMRNGGEEAKGELDVDLSSGLDEDEDDEDDEETGMLQCILLAFLPYVYTRTTTNP